jgi:hypothetical protein
MTVLSWYAKVQKSGTLMVAKSTKLKGGGWTTAFAKTIANLKKAWP